MYKLSLNGLWEMKEDGGAEWRKGTVPGSVYQNLLEEGIIENPFFGENEWNVQEVAKKNYVYRKKFEADKRLCCQEKIQLHLEGVDTISEIFVNGTSVLKTNNMHIPWEVDIKGQLHEGENTILVYFTSPFAYLEEIKRKNQDMDLERHLFEARLQMRKAEYMFGWDWGPVLADMGLWKSVEIRGYDVGKINDFKIEQEHFEGKVKLKCVPDIEILQEEDMIIRISVFNPEGEFLYKQDIGAEAAEFIIERPRLWWCRDYGEQPLYTVKCELIRNGEIKEYLEKRIGLRTLKLCQEKDKWGASFYFSINGVEVFARGADYIPEESMLGKINGEHTKQLLDSCIEANFNMIRVWGGGIYPSDEFLEYCDEKGLLVWQDFMFANVMTIWRGEEKENIIREVEYQTERLKTHPCIALLCGNNETELMMREDKVEEKYSAIYMEQYENEMARIVQEKAPNISYWPSSPSSGGNGAPVEDENYGDSHDWRVWHGELPFTHYRSTYPRFQSEFGLQSFPCIKTIESFTFPKDRNIFSYVMENHQKSKNGNRVIFSYISQYFKFPKDFRALVYLSQMIQMEGIRYGAEHWRRNRNDRRCMGVLFWQINDCWPVASWASIDYFGRWKGLQYGAKRFFEPVLVSACEEGLSVEIFLTNETRKITEGIVKWKLFNVKDGLVKAGAIPCSAQSFRTERIASLDFGAVVKTRQDKREYYLYYSYESKGKTVGEGTVLFVPAKHFNFEKPEIICEQIGKQKWKIFSNTYAKFVELSFGEDVWLSDNYFDLVPGQEKYITVKKEIKSVPEIYSLYDTMY